MMDCFIHNAFELYYFKWGFCQLIFFQKLSSHFLSIVKDSTVYYLFSLRWQLFFQIFYYLRILNVWIRLYLLNQFIMLILSFFLVTCWYCPIFVKKKGRKRYLPFEHHVARIFGAREFNAPKFGYLLVATSGFFWLVLVRVVYHSGMVCFLTCICYIVSNRQYWHQKSHSY